MVFDPYFKDNFKHFIETDFQQWHYWAYFYHNSEYGYPYLLHGVYAAIRKRDEKGNYLENAKYEFDEYVFHLPETWLNQHCSLLYSILVEEIIKQVGLRDDNFEKVVKKLQPDLNQLNTLPGLYTEIRIYPDDPGTGIAIVEVWHKSDFGEDEKQKITNFFTLHHPSAKVCFHLFK